MVAPTLFVRRTPSQVALGLAALIFLPARPGAGALPPPDALISRSAPPATATAAQTQAAVPTAASLSGVHFSTRGWKTNFANARIPLAELESGGPPRDGIPPIDQPKFLSPADAGAWLKDQEPVVAFEVSADARAYPLQILIWHEIVDDEVGGVPVAITFCPLCNTAIAFHRRVAGHT